MTLADRLQEAAGPKLPWYTAVVLDDSSRDKLLRWWRSEVGPLLIQHRAHHMTLKMKPSQSEVDKLSIGKQVKLSVTGYVNSDKVQVVAVTASMRSAKGVPHVTVAIGSGGRSRDSDGLLARGIQDVKTRLDLTGTVQGTMANGEHYVPGSGTI